MAFLLTYFQVPLSWGQILKRTFYDAFWKDNCLGMAAQLAYYFFFALFPTLLFLIALASYFPVETLIDDMFRTLGGFVPPEGLSIITDQIRKISEGENGGLLTLGVLIALWSSSAAMTAIIDTLNRAYDIEEGRPWWKFRLTAIGLTVGMAVFILISFGLILVGPTLAERVAVSLNLGPVFEWAWKILQWPLVFALVSTAIGIVYYFAPDAEQDWIWLTPGSVFATTLWLAASLGFKYYVANWGNYNETYGAIGAVMILMLWFYISGLVILIGAEMNAEIEHASPHGKEPGEKVPGQKRKIGPAAMRAWLARRRRHGEKPPSADEVRKAKDTGVADDGVPFDSAQGRPVSGPAAAPAFAMSAAGAAPVPVCRPALPPARRFSDWLIGAAVLGVQLFWAARVFRRKTRT
jgi:membrane protein